MRLPRLRTVWRGTVLVLKIMLVVLLAVALVTKLVGRHRLARAKAAFANAYGPPDPSAWEIANDERRPNAARLVRAAALALEFEGDERDLLMHADTGSPQAWSESQIRGLARLVERSRPSLELARRTIDIADSSYGVRCSFDTSLPPLRRIRELGKLLSVEAQLARGRNDDEAATRALKTQSRIVASLTSEGPFSMYLMAAAIEGEGAKLVAAWLQAPAARTSERSFVEGVAAALPTSDPLADWRRARAVEALAILNAHAVDFGASAGPRNPLVQLVATFSFWPLEELIQAEVMDSAVWMATLSRAKPRPDFLRRSSLESRQYLPHKWIAAIMEPSLRLTLRTATEMLSRRQLVRAGLQLRALGLDAGAYPASRPDLDVLRTPDPITGRPLVYAPQPDGSLLIELDRTAIPREEINPSLRRLALPAIH